MTAGPVFLLALAVLTLAIVSEERGDPAAARLRHRIIQ
jgi:hypothetical protein